MSRLSAGKLLPSRSDVPAPRRASSGLLSTERAHVSPAYADKVLEICDEQMIGTVDNLQTAAELGMLATLFKPVVAMGIQSALADVGAAGRAPSVAGVAAQIKDMLEDERQELKADAAAQPELAPRRPHTVRRCRGCSPLRSLPNRIVVASMRPLHAPVP